MSSKAIAGGLLTGLGRGMMTRAEQRREDALRQAAEMRDDRKRSEDREYQSGRDDLAHTRAMDRDRAAIDNRKGLISGTVTAEDGAVHGLFSDGNTKDLGIKTLPPGTKKTGKGDEDAPFEITAGEQRVLKEVRSQFVDQFGNLNAESAKAYIAHLRGIPADRGGARFNEIADYMAGNIGAMMTEKKAQEQAEREAEIRTGILSSRKTEFPETDGDMDAWKQQRAQELRGGLQQQGNSAAGAPAGMGSKQDPYRATTQDDIEWFKNEAPTGSVILVNGTFYTK